MPWVVLYPLALAGPWVLRRCDSNENLEIGHRATTSVGTRRAVWRLWTWTIAGIVLLSLAPARRWYYFLPLLPVACLLMAVVALALGRRLMDRGGGLWIVLIAAHVVGLGAILPTMWFTQSPAVRPSTFVAWSIAAFSLAVAVAVIVRLRRAVSLPTEQAAIAAWSLWAVGLTAALVLGVAAETGALWGASRIARNDFARQVAILVPRDEPLAGWRRDSNIEVYHAKRAIPHLEGMDELQTLIDGRARAWVLVINKGRPLEAPPGWSMTTALHADFSDDVGDDDRLELRRLDRLPPTAEPRQ